MLPFGSPEFLYAFPIVWKMPPSPAAEDVELLAVFEAPVGFLRPKSVALNVEEKVGPGGMGERKAGLPDSTKPTWSWMGVVDEFHQLPRSVVYRNVNQLNAGSEKTTHTWRLPVE
jgi:hypothetical protein